MCHQVFQRFLGRANAAVELLAEILVESWRQRRFLLEVHTFLVLISILFFLIIFIEVLLVGVIWVLLLLLGLLCDTDGRGGTINAARLEGVELLLERFGPLWNLKLRN